MDQDGDNSITEKEFRESLQREDVRTLMDALQITTNDAEFFFKLLDKDSSGEVDLVEFVEGMSNLRGEAKSVHIHMLLHENRRMLKVFAECMDLVGDPCGAEAFRQARSVKSSPGTCSPASPSSPPGPLSHCQ